MGTKDLEECAVPLFRMENWTKYAPPKRSHLSTKAHGITPYKTVTTMRNSNHTLLSFVLYRDGVEIWN
jgi:hypothetical protein